MRPFQTRRLHSTLIDNKKGGRNRCGHHWPTNFPNVLVRICDRSGHRTRIANFSNKRSYLTCSSIKRLIPERSKIVNGIINIDYCGTTRADCWLQYRSVTFWTERAYSKFRIHKQSSARSILLCRISFASTTFLLNLISISLYSRDFFDARAGGLSRTRTSHSLSRTALRTAGSKISARLSWSSASKAAGSGDPINSRK